MYDQLYISHEILWMSWKGKAQCSFKFKNFLGALSLLPECEEFLFFKFYSHFADLNFVL